jgi:hypothetical protein
MAIEIKEADILAACNKCGLFDKHLLPLFQSAWSERESGKKNLKLRKILDHVLKTQYKAVKIPGAAFDIVDMEGADADITMDPESKQWPVPFRFASKLFERPAGVVVTLGHELIHQFQIKSRLEGHYKAIQNWLGVNDVAVAFWELEAHTWELGSDFKSAYEWPFGGNHYLACLTSQERNLNQADRASAAERVNKAVSTAALRPQYLKQAATFIDCHRWAKEVWLKDNKNWQEKAMERK